MLSVAIGLRSEIGENARRRVLGCGGDKKIFGSFGLESFCGGGGDFSVVAVGECNENFEQLLSAVAATFRGPRQAAPVAERCR